ncbi:MAG: efflux RND transporter periplasmic adaptor subunit [Burkholderiales bacterium]|nr:efflux RND transporter periplasmic adaptor subunit [Burkholderiales bacterium]
MNNKLVPTILAAGFALIAGAGIGYWFATSQPAASHTGAASPEREVLYYRNPMNPEITSPVPAKDEMGMDYIAVYAEQERKPLYYRNPMNPEITSPVPAKDQMGMDYVPVYADDDSSGPAGTVKIDPVTEQNIGVRTATAEHQSLAREIHTVGRVDFDEQLITRLHPKTQGWIEDLRIGTTGEQISRDEILLSIYSPQLVSSQQEYLLALNNLDALSKSPFEDVRRGAEGLVETSLERLRLLDVPEHQIDELEQSREVKKELHIHSPAKGIVINVGAREGQFVTPQTELYMIADLSSVWVFVDLFEEEMPWVNVGDVAEMQVSAVPGVTFRGELTYIYPYAESKTRTIKARLEFQNPDLLLKPDMFADITIDASPRSHAVVIPSEAIVRSGLKEQVFVVRDAGKFEPREVEIGLSGGELTEILSGLAVGEEVVVSGQFLIDSESKLREAAAKMQEQSND